MRPNFTYVFTDLSNVKIHFQEKWTWSKRLSVSLKVDAFALAALLNINSLSRDVPAQS